METTYRQRRSRFKTVIDNETVERVKHLLLCAQNIVITCHVSPDGDALGSTLALCSVLRALGKDAHVVTADCAPKALLFMPGLRDVVTATRQPERAAELIAAADLVFCLDFNDLKRVDRLSPCFEQSKAQRVVIDHHLDPVIDCDVLISYPEVSSTSALVYIFLWQAGWTRYLNRSSAACIYTGMMTDTGNFSYNSNDPDLYLIIHDLLRKGIDKDNIYRLVHNNSTQSSLRINGYAQYRVEFLCGGRVALLMLSADDLREFDYSKGDTEGLVNTPLTIPEVQWSIFLREDSKDLVKVSMRSKGSFPVNLVCEREFGGGGHVNASGGEFHGSLTDAVSRLLEAIPNYENMLE
ncbi:MAG: bifunctional oligoribonuclease/PAP phosphatase NrnA [Duncaniella sp.]|nr:bifunctional oligoribonuclease/PAP phosphatase NrnA [Duncaniella sp.]